jgi:(2Fe-2S) ferredoxin
VKGSQKQVTPFVLEGRFLEVLGKNPSKPKYLRLATAEGEQLIKISKKLRPSLIESPLQVGSWITASGKETYKPKKRTRKRKIYQIQPHQPITAAPHPEVTASQATSEVTASSQPPAPKKKTKKDNILVCQKSSCCKRGGKAVYQAAMEAVEKHQLCDQVQVKATGCMGKCKKGPCMVLQADKSRHIGVKPEQAQELIAQRYTVSA